MKNTYGDSIALTIFGESHGPFIGAVLDGMPPGIKIDEEAIRYALGLRRPYGKMSTSRVEMDEFEIISGVFQGKTTGTAITIIIPNTVQHSKDYSATRALARPGHADYSANIKYHGYEDYRGGGHFSGRITAAVVAAGTIARMALEAKGIKIGTHISSIQDIEDRAFAEEPAALNEEIDALNSMLFAVLDDEKSVQMQLRIEELAQVGDSIGGTLETAVTGFPAGVGEPWWDSVESKLSHACMSIPGIKGIQFGIGFDGCTLTGSQYNDSFYMDGDDVRTRTNNNGGINGGITNGMPIIFKLAVKPTPSIYKEQETVDMLAKENAILSIKGRHDPAIIHRARIVVESVTAVVLCDMLAMRYGTDYLMQ